MSPPALPLPLTEMKMNPEETAQPGQSGNTHLQGAAIPTPAYNKHEQYSYLNFQQLHYPNHQDYNTMQYYMPPPTMPPATTGDMSGYPMMIMRPPDQPPPDAERKRKIRLAKNRESVRVYRQKKREDEVRFRNCVDSLKAEYAQLQRVVVTLEGEKKQLKYQVDTLDYEKKQLKNRVDTLEVEKRGS